MLCVITRIKVARLSSLIWMVIAFLRIRRQARAVHGLREMSLLIRRQRTIVIISLWEDQAAMADFATVSPEHPRAVYRLWQERGEFWSGLFELVGPSPRSVPWIHVSGRTTTSVGR